MANRKSVSADASSSSIRPTALANSVLSRRIVGLTPLCATGSRGGEARNDAALCCAITVFRRFAPSWAVALVFFFMGISALIPQSHRLGLSGGGWGFCNQKTRTLSGGPFLNANDHHLSGKCAEVACRDSPRQDSPFRTPCHALPNLGPILYLRHMFLDSRKELTA